MDINEVGFYEDQKIFEKTSKLKGSTIIIEENNTIVVNLKNKRKNKIIVKINHIRNHNEIIKWIKQYIQQFSYNKINGIHFQFLNIISRINITGIKNILLSIINIFVTIYYQNVLYINGNKHNTLIYSYDKILFYEPELDKHITYLSFPINIILIKVLYYNWRRKDKKKKNERKMKKEKK